MAHRILLTMAGQGQRFIQAGYEKPKPFIEIDGRASYLWALCSFDLKRAKQIIIVALKAHLEGYHLAKEVVDIFGCSRPVIIPIDKVTQGQACTALLAREFIDNDDALVIHNCDTYVRSKWALSADLTRKDADGVISVFKAEGDHWSFARTDKAGMVIEVAEKRRISQWATTGMYHFSRGADFVYFADKMINSGERAQGEFYIAPVYENMIKSGKDIVIDLAEEVWCSGTPTELEQMIKEGPKWKQVFQGGRVI